MSLSNRFAYAALSVALLAAGPAAAQTAEPERWQIQREDGEYLWDLRLGSLRGDTLMVRQADTLVAVPVNTIRELRLVRKTTMRIGDGAGGAAPYSALMGGNDEVYDLGALEFGERLQVLREVLTRHPAPS